MELFAKVSTPRTGSVASTILLHSDVYADPEFRKNARVSLLIPKTPKSLTRRKARALGQALIEKGLTIQIKKALLREEYELAETQGLKPKPDINVASQRIVKKKVERAAMSQPVSGCVSPSCRYNSPAKDNQTRTGVYNSVQAAVDLSQARVYQALLNKRKAQYCRRMLK